MKMKLYEEEMNDLFAYFDKTSSSVMTMRDEFNSNFQSLTNIGLGDFGLSVLLSQMDNMTNSLNGLKKCIKNNVDSLVEEENLLLNGLNDAIVIEDFDGNASTEENNSKSLTVGAAVEKVKKDFSQYIYTANGNLVTSDSFSFSTNISNPTGGYRYVDSNGMIVDFNEQSN